MKIYLFYCATSFDPAELAQDSDAGRDEIKVVPLPCSGKIDVLYLIKAFETGADGVAVVTCKPGDCRYLEGNLRARKRAEAVDALLGETGLGKGRMRVIQLTDGGMEQVMQELTDFYGAIRALSAQVSSNGLKAPYPGPESPYARLGSTE